jgi:hypothetical protein
MSPKIATARRHVPFEDLGMFHAVLTLAGFHANYLDAGVDCPGNLDSVTPDVLVVLGGLIGACESEKYPLRCKNRISCAGASQSDACRLATPTRLKVRASTERHCGPGHNRMISDLRLPAGRCSQTGWSNFA